MQAVGLGLRSVPLPDGAGERAEKRGGGCVACRVYVCKRAAGPKNGVLTQESAAKIAISRRKRLILFDNLRCKIPVKNRIHCSQWKTPNAIWRAKSLRTPTPTFSSPAVPARARPPFCVRFAKRCTSAWWCSPPPASPPSTPAASPSTRFCSSPSPPSFPACSFAPTSFACPIASAASFAVSISSSSTKSPWCVPTCSTVSTPPCVATATPHVRSAACNCCSSAICSNSRPWSRTKIANCCRATTTPSTSFPATLCAKHPSSPSNCKPSIDSLTTRSCGSSTPCAATASTPPCSPSSMRATCPNSVRPKAKPTCVSSRTTTRPIPSTGPK